MKSNVLDLLIDLFEDAQGERLPFDAQTLDRLEKLGFDQDTIADAYAWFHESQQYPEAQHVNEPSRAAIRIYNPEEMSKLSAHCRGLISSLEQSGILTTQTREMIITQMMQLDVGEMDLEQLKWLSIISLSDHLDDETISRLLNQLLLHAENAEKAPLLC